MPGAAYTYISARLTPSAVPAARPRPNGATWAVYPNPARASVAVAGLPAGTAVLVLDALGRRVAGGPVPTGGVLHLPLALPPGVYVVRAAGQARRLLVE